MRIFWLWAVVVAGGVGCACWGPAPVPAPPLDTADTKISFPLVRPLDGGLLVTPVEIGSDWYLFELDPLAPRTRIDGDVVAHGSDDETAHVRLTAGGTVSNVEAELFDVRSIPRAGMDIMGVLGRDVLRDELVFGVDRDAGIAWLAGPHAFTPPAAISPVPYLASSTGDVSVFGEAFFAPFDIAFDRSRELLYLAPRTHTKQTAITRIARWGGTPCKHLGCVVVSVTAGSELSIRRDPSALAVPLEVTLVAIGLPDAPRLHVGLPADVGDWQVPLAPRYAGHALVVTDMSPFPRPCTEAITSSCAYLDEVARTH